MGVDVNVYSGIGFNLTAEEVKLVAELVADFLDADYAEDEDVWALRDAVSQHPLLSERYKMALKEDEDETPSVMIFARPYCHLNGDAGRSGIEEYEVDFAAWVPTYFDEFFKLTGVTPKPVKFLAGVFFN